MSKGQDQTVNQILSEPVHMDPIMSKPLSIEDRTMWDGFLRSENLTELDISLAHEDSVFWCMMKPLEKPSFTIPLLEDLACMQGIVRRIFQASKSRSQRPFDYFVLGSSIPGVFNLGGDLNLFVEKIQAGEREALRRYGYACSAAAHANYNGYENGVITIALVQGDALGGGFEAALSCDLVISERHAKFGLPEVLFNLFPGMGAYSYLSRRIGPVAAERMILSGKIFSAQEMLDAGVIDIVADDGLGEQALLGYIAAHRARKNTLSALFKVRRRVSPVTIEELRDIVDVWVDAAMTLQPIDLRKMSRIAAAQDRSRARMTVQMKHIA